MSLWESRLILKIMNKYPHKSLGWAREQLKRAFRNADIDTDDDDAIAEMMEAEFGIKNERG